MTVPNVELAVVGRDEEELDYSGLLDFLREEERLALDDQLNSERATALDFYNGEPFGDEEDGRSQVVTRDVAEVIDYATVSLIRTMMSGSHAVEFECADKRVAQEATAAVGQEFYQGQDGYRVLHDWIKAGLLEKSSVCKACVEEQAPARREAVIGAEEMALMAEQMAEQGAQFIAAAPVDDDETQWAVAWAEKRPTIFRDYVVPNEESGIAFDARDLDHDCAYSQFRMRRSVSQIAEMGYDVSALEDESYNDTQTELSTARDDDARNSWLIGSNRRGPNRSVWLLEEYARYDLDGDGITELLKVHRVGAHILHVEPIDEQPGVVWCPFPMPHRILGQSLADKVMDIQRVRSVLMRQALDNIYQSNAPRWTVSEGSMGDTTIDDLLTVRAGGIIRHVGVQAPTAVAVPFVADNAFEFMQVLSGEKESRTGITRLNQGLDPDALNQTATGTAMMQASGQQIEDYMARNFAEAFARLMLKKYRLMRQFGSPMTVTIDGKDVEINPRQWPDSMKVRVRVGLGTGRKEERLQHRVNLLQITQAAMQQGLRVFTEENVFNQVAGVIEDSSIGSVSEFVTDPKLLGEQPEKPDPEMMKAQADAMIQAEKVKADQQKAAGDQMLKARQMEIDAQMKQQQLEYDLQAKREKAALDEQLARDKAIFEANLAQQQADREWQLAVMKIEQEKELAKMKADSEVKKYREGGALNE